MKFPRSSRVPFIAMCASMLTVSACSTRPEPLPTAPQASIPAHLLVKPAPAPEIPRSIDPATGEAKIDGSQVIVGATGLYDYIGSVVGQLDALIDAVHARDAAPAPKKKRKLF